MLENKEHMRAHKGHTAIKENGETKNKNKKSKKHTNKVKVIMQTKKKTYK